jgi:flagellar protein FliO/FliZ
MNWTVWDWLHYLLNFGLVIVVMLGCLWALKRLQGKSFALTTKKASRLQIIESLSVGPRQKVLLIAIDGRELLIGSTAHEITTLSANPMRVSERA